MRIYTRCGDGGRTRDISGRNVSKSDPVIEAVGCLDELSVHIGLSMVQSSSPRQPEVRAALAPLQAELIVLGAVLGGKTRTDARVRIDESSIAAMERAIDDACGNLADLASFILPGGCELACRLHVARTVCRRAERAAAALADTGRDVPAIVMQHLNRLGDLLFALARLANHNAGVAETVFEP